MCAVGFKGPKSSNRIQLSRFVQKLLKFFWFGFPLLGRVGQVDGGYLGWTNIVYMSSGVFRSKESSNRIELSRLVQDLLNFGVLGSLRLWGWGGLGVPPTHVHMHMHAHMHMHTHIHVKHDNFNCKLQPPLGKSLGIPYDVICVCTCMCASACACVWGAPSHHPPSPSPHPPVGGPPESVKIQWHLN